MGPKSTDNISSKIQIKDGCSKFKTSNLSTVERACCSTTNGCKRYLHLLSIFRFVTAETTVCAGTRNNSFFRHCLNHNGKKAEIDVYILALNGIVFNCKYRTKRQEQASLAYRKALYKCIKLIWMVKLFKSRCSDSSLWSVAVRLWEPTVHAALHGLHSVRRIKTGALMPASWFNPM